MRTYYYIISITLLSLTACRTQYVPQVVERAVVVHDTVHVTVPQQQRHPLDHVMQAALNDCDSLLRGAHTALCIADIDHNIILAAQDETVRMRTASVMKLVTAITALHTVPSTDSAFVTRILTDGTKAWVRGGWDPMLGIADIRTLVSTARRNLPSKVQANKGMATGCPISVDMAGQDDAHYGKGWCWDDHNPLLTPLFYAPTIEQRKRNPIMRPEQDFIDAFAREWRKAPANGSSTSTHTAGKTVAACIARPLPEVLAPMLKNSDNLMAEATWRLTGESESARQEALAQVLTAAGVDANGVTQADGSGLSLYNYATPLSLVRLLFWAESQPFAPTLHSSLALMGVDGTLKSRRVHGARVEAKTGTVEGVITLAGYMTLVDGRRLAIAVMVNGAADKGNARAATDILLARLAAALQQ